MTSILAGSLIGVALGMRHALEPDHLAAVSTLIPEQEPTRRAALLGAWWGAGHAAALLVIGVPALMMRAAMPSSLDQLLELVVAVVLLALGARAIARVLRSDQPDAGPTPGHAHAPRPVRSWSFARRPFLVGLAHGLAGSGALIVLASATMPSLESGVLFAVLFAIGSIAGMAAITGALGLPLQRLMRTSRLRVPVICAVGLFSMGLGAWWGAPALQQLLGA